MRCQDLTSRHNTSGSPVGLFKHVIMCVVVVAVLLNAVSGLCERKHKRRLKLKPKRLVVTKTDTNLADVNLRDSLQDIFEGSLKTYIFDPVDVRDISILVEANRPLLDRDDYNIVENRRLAQRAIAISAKSIVRETIKNSDIAEYVETATLYLSQLDDLLSFSLRNTGDGVTVDKHSYGEDLFTIGLQVGVRNGFDPVMNITDSLRLRYDLGSGRTMCEYSIKF